jgi:hypothetical protein
VQLRMRGVDVEALRLQPNGMKQLYLDPDGYQLCLQCPASTVGIRESSRRRPRHAKRFMVATCIRQGSIVEQIGTRCWELLFSSLMHVDRDATNITLLFARSFVLNLRVNL